MKYYIVNVELIDEMGECRFVSYAGKHDDYSELEDLSVIGEAIVDDNLDDVLKSIYDAVICQIILI